LAHRSHGVLRDFVQWTAGGGGQLPPELSEADEAGLRALGYIEE
jgi:hypothetical protein